MVIHAWSEDFAPSPTSACPIGKRGHKVQKSAPPTKRKKLKARRQGTNATKTEHLAQAIYRFLSLSAHSRRLLCICIPCSYTENGLLDVTSMVVQGHPAPTACPLAAALPGLKGAVLGRGPDPM